MTIKIPDKWGKIPLDKAFDEPDIPDDKSQQAQPTQLISNPNISPRKYIQVQGVNGLYGKQPVISRYEILGYNNTNWNDEHYQLAENGLYMPTPKIFMQHFNNVVNAQNKKGNLFYADGTKVDKKDIEDIYFHLTKNHIAAYGNQEGAWTWLNARFVKEKNEFFLEEILGIDTNKNLVARREKLENCLMEDAYIDFKKLTSQGLAKPDSKTGKQDYDLGKNIRFWHPVEDRVAGFGAGSAGADLGCDRYPTDTYSGLGVFGCGEL